MCVARCSPSAVVALAPSRHFTSLHFTSPPPLCTRADSFTLWSLLLRPDGATQLTSASSGGAVRLCGPPPTNQNRFFLSVSLSLSLCLLDVSCAHSTVNSAALPLLCVSQCGIPRAIGSSPPPPPVHRFVVFARSVVAPFSSRRLLRG